jgi:hypothetical protein
MQGSGMQIRWHRQPSLLLLLLTSSGSSFSPSSLLSPPPPPLPSHLLYIFYAQTYMCTPCSPDSSCPLTVEHTAFSEIHFPQHVATTSHPVALTAYKCRFTAQFSKQWLGPPPLPRLLFTMSSSCPSCAPQSSSASSTTFGSIATPQLESGTARFLSRP